MKPKDLLKKIGANREPSQEFRTKLKQSLVAYMKDNQPLPIETPFKKNGPAPYWRKALVISFAALVMVCVGTAGTVFAAQKTLPGDTLYGIKLAVDQMAVAISNSPNVRVAVADRRLAEVKQVLMDQPVPNDRSRADIQSALREYRSDLEGIVANMGAASSTSHGAVTNILQKTADNENDLEQMISNHENGALVQDLEDSLHSSAAFRNFMNGTGTATSASSTNIAPSALRFTEASSSLRNNVRHNNARYPGEISHRTSERSGAPTSTPAFATTTPWFGATSSSSVGQGEQENTSTFHDWHSDWRQASTSIPQTSTTSFTPTSSWQKETFMDRTSTAPRESVSGTQPFASSTHWTSSSTSPAWQNQQDKNDGQNDGGGDGDATGTRNKNDN